MDTRFLGCIDLWQKQTGRIADDSEKQSLWYGYQELKRASIKEGKRMDEVVDEIVEEVNGQKITRQVTYAEKALIEKWGKIQRRNLLQDLQEYALQAKGILYLDNRIKNSVENLKANNPKKANDTKWLNDARARAVIGMIQDTNDTFGTVPLDKLKRTEISQYFGDFDASVRKRFKQEFGDEIDADAYMTNAENKPNILTELFEFEKNRGQHNSPKTTKEAYIVAQELYRNTTLAHKLNMSASGGRFLRYNRMGLQLRWNKHRVAKMSRQQFIDEVAPALDDVHGDLTYRQNLAGQVYDDILKFDDKKSWRTIGDDRADVLNEITQTTGTNPNDKGSKLLWRDGESFSKLTAKYSDDHTFQQLVLSHVTELGREMAILKFTGNASNDAGLANIKTLIKNTVNKQQLSPIRKAQLEASENYLEMLVSPAIFEQTKWLANFQALRNIQAAAKLGSAVITALLDIPMFIVTGRTIFNLPLLEMIGKVFKQIPGIGAGEEKLFARYFLEVSESWQNAASMRYILNDGNDMGTKFSRGTAGFAHLVFKGSGLNWWTQNLQSSAAGLYSKHLGDLVREGTKYSDFTPKFKENLMKYGIGEAEWAETLARNAKNGILDDKGRLDLYKMGTTTSAGTSEVGRQNLRQKYISAVSDAVDTMVMKPSEFDKMTAALFFKDGAIMNQVMRTFTQFKAHPISMMRKVWGRTLKSDQQSVIWTGTGLIAGMMTMGAVTVQLKEFLAGRQPYDAGSEDYWIRVAREAGVAGLAGDIMMDFGLGTLVDELFSEEKAKQITKDQLLNSVMGPLLGDISALMYDGVLKGIQGGIRYGTGKDDGELLLKSLGNITKLSLGTLGLERLWYTKMVYRAFIGEWLGNMFDPDGYERRERSFLRAAQESKIGRQKDNFIYKGLQDIF